MKRKSSTEIKRANLKVPKNRYYNLNSILGNDWAIFYVITGGRKTGKSYSVTDFLCHQKDILGPQCKNYWMRISETSTKAMLANKANKLVDPDLYRKYDLDLSTKAGTVYNKGKPWMEVYPLSSFAKLKGVGFYDKDYEGQYNIVLDEFQLEEGEKRTSFDILYNFIGMCENLVRTTKTKVRVFLLGNTLEEASTILKAFNFLPDKFGRFYLKSKRCVIDNLEPTDEYLKDRHGSIADILGGGDMSNYTNQLKKDTELIDKRRLSRPQYVIKFTKDKSEWYTVYEHNVVRRYRNEPMAKDLHIAMRPYLDTLYSKEKKQAVIDLFDVRMLKFDSLITLSYFQSSLAKLRKS